MSGSSAPDRTSRALTAAVDAGRELGLTVTDPAVLHDDFTVVVHLAPSPVVVRVPTVLPPWTRPETQARQQRRELDVVTWLARQGFPVVVPSPLVPAAPVSRDGHSMTFWQWADHRPPAEPDWTADTAAAADLHRAMRDYPGELAHLPFLAEVPEALAFLRERPDILDRAAVDGADLDRAEREWDALAPVVTTPEGLLAAFPDAEIRPVHGDSPTYNLVKTPAGALYSDFELVCLAPVEWDLTFLQLEAVEAYAERAAALGLRAPDGRLLAVMAAARMLQVVSILAMAPQRPELAETLQRPLGIWRGTAFAGGLTAAG